MPVNLICTLSSNVRHGLRIVLFDTGCPSVTVLEIYEQCGGLATNKPSYVAVDGPYTCTKCAEGTTCTRKDAYYYQCLPPSGEPEL